MKRGRREPKKEMSSARGRLKGLLKNIAEEEQPVRASRGRPPKSAYKTRRNEKVYLMKLFDRSVNLGKFEEDTPLYPICRAWFCDNQKVFSKPEPPAETGPVYYAGRENIAKSIRSKKNVKITAMPRPYEADDQPYPTYKKPSAKLRINLNYDLDQPLISREQLMKRHKERWTKVRKTWQEHTENNASRYEESFKVLEAMSC